MNWADFKIAVAQGLVASAESVANIISGATKVGNADKLDGYDASSFALVKGYTPNYYYATTSDNADQILADLHNNATNGEYYIARIGFSVSHPVLAGAERVIIGCRATEKFGWQMGISYSSAGAKNIMFREVLNGTWNNWREVATTTDLAKYLPLTGAKMTGNIDMNGKKVMGCSGTYTDKLADQYINACMEIREKDFIQGASTDIGYAPALGFHWAGIIGATILMDSNGDFHFVNNGGSYCSLKTSSANVIVSTTAPTDTTAVWIIPS